MNHIPDEDELGDLDTPLPAEPTKKRPASRLPSKQPRTPAGDQPATTDVPLVRLVPGSSEHIAMPASVAPAVTGDDGRDAVGGMERTGPLPVDRDIESLRRMAEPAVIGAAEFEADTWGKKVKSPARFLFASVGVFAAVLVVGVWLVNQTREPAEESPWSIEAPLGKIVISPETDLDENSQGQVSSIAMKYAGAKSVHEILPLVREAERVLPALENEWKPLNFPNDWIIPKKAKWTLHLAGRREYGVLRNDAKEGDQFRFYFVKDGGRLALDWEATAGYCEIPYSYLAIGEGKGGIVRGFISPADYYTLALPEGDFRSYRITSPSTETAIWGYTRLNATAAEQLDGLFVQGAVPRKILPEYRVTLRLGTPPSGSLPNQWLIEGMEHLEWVSP